MEAAGFAVSHCPGEPTKIGHVEPTHVFTEQRSREVFWINNFSCGYFCNNCGGRHPRDAFFVTFELTNPLEGSQ